MSKPAQIAKAGRKLVFEGQTHLYFLADGAAAVDGHHYLPRLADCDDETRSKRLINERKQPELANDDMIAGRDICDVRLSRAGARYWTLRRFR